MNSACMMHIGACPATIFVYPVPQDAECLLWPGSLRCETAHIAPRHVMHALQQFTHVHVECWWLMWSLLDACACGRCRGAAAWRLTCCRRATSPTPSSGRRKQNDPCARRSRHAPSCACMRACVRVYVRTLHLRKCTKTLASHDHMYTHMCAWPPMVLEVVNMIDMYRSFRRNNSCVGEHDRCGQAAGCAGLAGR